MNPLIEWVIYIVAAFASMVLAHELAHLSKLREYRPKAKVYWEKGSIVVGTHKDYEGLTNKQLYMIYSEGVYMGIAPIFPICFLVHPIYILMIIPYIGFCWNDIKNMKKVR